MPITVISPLPDHFFGPGYAMALQSSVIGPPGPDWSWRVRIGPELEPSNNTDGFFQLRVVSNPQSFTFGDLSNGLAYASAPIGTTEQGSAVRLIAELVQGNTILDTGNVDVKYDPVGQLSQLFQTVGGSQTGGFTQSDRDLLLAVQQAVIQPLQQTGRPTLSSPIIAWFADRNPISSIFVRRAPLLISGDGTITPSSQGTLGLGFGVQWSFFTVPAGFGRIHGVRDRFEQRILQLALERRDAGLNTYLENPLDIAEEGGIMRFEPPTPVALHFSCAPGCEVVLQFLDLPLTSAVGEFLGEGAGDAR